MPLSNHTDHRKVFMKGVISPIALMTLLLGLSGCATVQVEPSNAEREGIAAVLDRHVDVDVIFIHGMSYEDKEWAASTNLALSDAMGGSFDAKAFSEAPGIDLGNRGAKLYQGTIAYNAKIIHTYAILWSPITVPFKETLCYDVSQPNPPVCPTGNGERRAVFNSFLKSTILDGSLSDVVFYLGDEWGGAHVIRDAVTEALRIILKERSSSSKESIAGIQRPLFIMTESLGSKILWDSINGLACASGTEQDALIGTLGSVEHVFMAANQIPILSPMESIAPAADCIRNEDATFRVAEKPLSGLRGVSALVYLGKKRKNGSGEPLKIVAFSDPNDILSYKLGPYFAAECKIDKTFCSNPDVVDVGPHNDTNWFGIVENPASAHTTYWNNPYVKRVLKCGLPLNDCR
jgi:hypothetical protein